MPVGINTIKTMNAVAIGAVIFSATVAAADTANIPDLGVSVSSSLGGTTAFNPSDYGSAWQNSNNTFGFSGTKSTDTFGLGWSMLVNPDPFVIANIVVTNNTAFTQTFSITVSLPVLNFNPPNGCCIGGSVTGSVTDLNGNGATFASPALGSVYTANIDNAPVQTLLNDPFNVTTGNFLSKSIGPASFGDPIPSLPWPCPTQNIGITLSFTLSAGDVATLTSIFVVEECIPAPAGLALLGFVGLAAGSRRRRS